MKIFYAAETNGFYRSDIHGDAIPAGAVNLTEQEYLALLNAQSSGATIMPGEDGRPTLSALISQQSLAWEQIKAERDRRINQGGYKVGENWFHSDQLSRIQQLVLVLLGINLSPGLQWKTMDGSFVLMTPQLAGQILAAAAASDQAIFATAEGHRLSMEASADPESYDFYSGWPSVFGE